MISNAVLLVLALLVFGAIAAAWMSWVQGISYFRAVKKLWDLGFKSWEFASVRVALSGAIGMVLWGERSQWGHGSFLLTVGAGYCTSYSLITLFHAIARAIAHGNIMGSTEAIAELEEGIDPTEAYRRFVESRKPASWENPSRRGGPWAD